MSTEAERDERVRAFEQERPHMFAVAYRMLGSRAEAEDVVQEAFMRWTAREWSANVSSPTAFLTRIVVRLSLDQLKSARARRETYVGPWLPEPLLEGTTTGSPPALPNEPVELAESLSVAFLVLLERLSPLERAAFLLREVFDHPFEEVASVLATSEAAARQHVSRARAHIEGGRARFRATEEKKQELLVAFTNACASGDVDGLARLLAVDVVARTDGGGKAVAASRPIEGKERVARFLIGIARKAASDYFPSPCRVNGEPGIVVRDSNSVVQSVITLSIANDRISDVWIMSNPDKLARATTGKPPGITRTSP